MLHSNGDFCFEKYGLSERGFFSLRISLARKKSAGLESAATIRTKVFVWGLNDKDQLGGLKGSKVRPAAAISLSWRPPRPAAGLGSSSICPVDQGALVL